MQTILFPTDFSETANHALPWALDYAKRAEAELLVVHVFHIQPIDPYAAELLSQNLMKEKQEEAQTKLTALLKKLESEHGFTNVRTDVRFGFAVEEVLAVAKEEEVDLIVAGTAGAQGWEKWFLGSNAGALVDEAPVPVLVVPNEATFRPLKRLAYGTDLGELDLVSLLNLKRWAELYDAELVLLHATDRESTVALERIEHAMEDMANLVNYDRVRTEIVRGEPVADALVAHAEAGDYDLVVTSHQKRGFFKKLLESSFTKKLAYSTKLPLLALQSPLQG